MNDALINAMLRAPTGFSSRLRVAGLRALGARIGPRCRLVGTRVPQNPWDVELAEGVALDARVVLLAFGPRLDRPRISIGARTYINRGTIFDASLRIDVGADVMIGPFCYLTDHDHGTAGDAPVRTQNFVEAPVEIRANAWIGAGVTVLKGVTIGSNAVVGAGSVVTKSVPDGARVAGAPASRIEADLRGAS